MPPGVGYGNPMFNWMQQVAQQQTPNPFANAVGGASGFGQSGDPRSMLGGQADQAGGFANTAEQNYNNMTAESQATRDFLGRLMRGENSLAAEQLRQGLQQTTGQLRSQAAAASPANAGMAALQASNNIGRAGSAMAGNAAMAGIAERNAAAQALGQMQLGARGQDVNAALGSRGNAITGYQGQIKPPQPSWWERGLGALTGLGGAALSNPSLFGGGNNGNTAQSDRRSKTDIADGKKDSERLLEGLRAYTYRYKDEDKHGKGRRTGIMAQDVERVAPHAVIDTPEGKKVHGAHLATALAAALPGMHERIKKLEGKK